MSHEGVGYSVMCPLCAGHQTNILFKSGDRVHGIPGVFTSFQCIYCKVVFTNRDSTGKSWPTFIQKTTVPIVIQRTGMAKELGDQTLCARESLRLSIGPGRASHGMEAGECVALISGHGKKYHSLSRRWPVSGRRLWRGFLSLPAQELGVDVYGVDPSSAAVS